MTAQVATIGANWQNRRSGQKVIKRFFSTGSMAMPAARFQTSNFNWPLIFFRTPQRPSWPGAILHFQSQARHWTNLWSMFLDKTALCMRAAYIIEQFASGRWKNGWQQKKNVPGLDTRTWTQNLYWGWLWQLRPLLEKKGDGYPAFMPNKFIWPVLDYFRPTRSLVRHHIWH